MIPYIRDVASDMTIYRSQSTKQTVTLDHIALQHDKTTLAMGHIREDTMSLKRQLEEIAGQLPSQMASGSVMLSAETRELDDDSCAKAIISSLMFSHINQREEAIPKAYEQTFKWMLNQPKASESEVPLTPPFVPWLEGPSSDIYWITGKPGAGKSTMMKYLLQHPVTREKVTIWSEGSRRRLLWGSFFFWNAGSPIQKSHEGLLRALLSQFIEQAPDIAPRICPRRWALCKALGTHSINQAPDWQWKELMEAFSLLSLHIGDLFNLFLLIDGLDEFEGDHEKLIEFTEALNLRSGTKICVSSRPWNVFSDAFKNSRTLRMDQVTADDILLYVRGVFEKTPAFRDWKEYSSKQAETLMRDIVIKAQGVFLWVAVVVTQIRLGLSEGDKTSDLQAVLEDIPADLSSLYDNIWRRIKPCYIRSSSQIFQIHQCAIDNNEKMDAVLLYLADEDLSALDEDIDVLMETRQRHVAEVVKRRLDSRTRGLLEVANDGYVNYLHRTVREWIEPMWSEICLSASPEFDPNLAVLKAIILYRSASEQWSIINSMESLNTKIWLITLRCFNHAIRVRDVPHSSNTLVELLDKLDLEMTKVWDAHRKTTASNEQREPGFSLRRAQALIPPAVQMELALEDDIRRRTRRPAVTVVPPPHCSQTQSMDSRSAEHSAPHQSSTSAILDAHFSQTKFMDFRSAERSTPHPSRAAAMPDAHWSQTQSMNFRSAENKMDFVGLAAQFGVVSFVRSKCRADADLFSPSSSRPALLSCAVLGFQHFCSDGGVMTSFERLIEDKNTYNGRIEITRFILDGVDSKPTSQLDGILEQIRALTLLVESYPERLAETADSTVYRDSILGLLRQSRRHVERRQPGKAALRRLGNMFRRR